MQFAFGPSEQERITIDVRSYERPASGEYWDDNWLVTNISVVVGGFCGRVGANIMTAELVRFSEELYVLYERLTGTAEFTTLEGQLLLKLTGDGRGHIQLEGQVLDQAGIGNRLSFALDFDQTFLPQSMRDLDSILHAFPVRGASI